MKRLLVLPVLLLYLFVGNPAFSADFQEGWDAYNKKDYATVLKEWTPLAEQGNADAQNNVGWMYAEGNGVPQNDRTAVKWYTLAANQGLALAQFNLGVMSYAGKGGVMQDNIYAHMWWNLAASQGDENARKYRDIIEKKMFPSQIEKAQDLARECVKKNYKGC